MRGTRAIIMLVLSLAAGLAAVVLAARWINEQNASGQSQIVVASRDVDLGQPLNASMVQLVPWPAGGIPAGSFRDIKDIDTRVLKVQMLRGEPVVEAKLAPIGTKGGLSAVIGQGKRAITVKVNEVVGVAGFALPGNYVDVLVSTQDEKEKPVSKIVLERILVLAVAQEASRDDTKPRVVNAVTLEVTPEQAERLDLSRSVGSLSLVLRNQVDQNASDTNGVHKSDLLGKSSFEPPVAPVAEVAPAKPQVKPRPKQQAKPAVVVPPVAKVDNTVRIEVIRGVQRSNSDL
jgi:pilus assembly protein CpaB